MRPRCLARWMGYLDIKNSLMEVWIRERLCANCATKNLHITGALQAYGITSMLNIAASVEARANADQANVSPSTSKQSRQPTLDQMTGFRALC